MSREKVLAAVVRLLETTLIRVGNDEYARLNRSFGLTTLKSRHATVTGTKVRFRSRGKRAEAALRGQTLTDQVVEDASRIAAEEARPIDDVRSTADYRREMVRVLTRRGLGQAMERARA